MKTSLAAALAAALSLVAAGAHAEVRVSGFGQIIAGTLTNEGDHFPERHYTDEVDFRDESKFALQFDADLNDRVSATAQVLADGKDDFDPKLAWAYANVKLGEGFSLKAGRQRIPFYRYSDYLDVGYAYPWIRPPVAMYNQPWSNADGISLSHNTYFGKWYSSAQALYGRFEGDVEILQGMRHGELDGLTALAWELEYDEWLSFRAAYVQADVTITGSTIDQLSSTLRAVGQAGRADAMDYIDDKGTFESVGVKVDRNGWLAVGEYARVNVDDSILDNIGRRDWYVSLGRRFGKVTPTLTHGSRKADVNESLVQGIPTASPLYVPVLTAASSQALDETYDSLGVRWDFADNVALKADWTRFRSELASTPDADLVSAGLVFTF